MYVLYREEHEQYSDEWYDDYRTSIEIIGIYKKLFSAVKTVGRIRKSFVDRLVLEDALEEAHYWDTASVNRITYVTGIHSEKRIVGGKSRFEMSFTIGREYGWIQYTYVIERPKHYFG